MTSMINGPAPGVAERSLGRRDVLRFAGAAGLGLAGLPALGACGGKSSTASHPGTITFQGWDYEPQLVQKNLKTFQQQNPKLKVDYTAVVSANYINKLTAEFTGKTAPDALYVYDDSLAGWVDAGYLEPLDGMPGIDETYQKLYKENAAAMTYQGKRYGLPYYTDNNALVYNADVLKKAGISRPPATWEELESQAIKIKQQGILEYPLGFTAQLQNTYWSWWWRSSSAAVSRCSTRTSTRSSRTPAACAICSPGCRVPCTRRRSWIRRP